MMAELLSHLLYYYCEKSATKNLILWPVGPVAQGSSWKDRISISPDIVEVNSSVWSCVAEEH